MTMPNAAHPDPERLAALAGDDADARADGVLLQHVTSCADCERQVSEMAALRLALAQLPDLTPSRPLQYVPPVPAASPSGWRTALRRTLAPVAVAGMVLSLVGGVGAIGVLGPAEAPRLSFSFFQMAAPAPDQGQPEVDGGGGTEATDSGSERPGTASPLGADGGAGFVEPTPPPPAAVGGQDDDGEPATRGENLDGSTTTTGWVFVLAVGVGLLAMALVLRAAAPGRGSAPR